MKKTSLLFPILVFIGTVTVRSQTLNTVSGDQQINGGTGTTTVRPTLKINGTGGVLFGGITGFGSIPAEGAGTRMMWYPKKAAFRAGSVETNQWDDINIGLGSFAVGTNSIASEENSIALGYSESAGFGSTAIGISYASGIASVAIGSATTFGDASVALGQATAEGNESTAIGYYASAHSFCSTVLGVNNLPRTGNSTAWVATDDLLVVGNGTIDFWGSPESQSNAMVITKNGNTRFAGQIQAKGMILCAPGGDISMGGFTSGANPATLNAGLKYTGE